MPSTHRDFRWELRWYRRRRSCRAAPRRHAQELNGPDDVPPSEQAMGGKQVIQFQMTGSPMLCCSSGPEFLHADGEALFVVLPADTDAAATMLSALPRPAGRGDCRRSRQWHRVGAERRAASTRWNATTEGSWTPTRCPNHRGGTGSSAAGLRHLSCRTSSRGGRPDTGRTLAAGTAPSHWRPDPRAASPEEDAAGTLGPSWGRVDSHSPRRRAS